MKLQDYVILAVIAVWFVLALRSILRRKGGCGCCGTGCGAEAPMAAGCASCKGTTAAGCASRKGTTAAGCASCEGTMTAGCTSCERTMTAGCVSCKAVRGACGCCSEKENE